jgi:hypothetical protein
LLFVRSGRTNRALPISYEKGLSARLSREAEIELRYLARPASPENSPRVPRLGPNPQGSISPSSFPPTNCSLTISQPRTNESAVAVPPFRRRPPTSPRRRHNLCRPSSLSQLLSSPRHTRQDAPPWPLLDTPARTRLHHTPARMRRPGSPRRAPHRPYSQAASLRRGVPCSRPALTEPVHGSSSARRSFPHPDFVHLKLLRLKLLCPKVACVSGELACVAELPGRACARRPGTRLLFLFCL